MEDYQEQEYEFLRRLDEERIDRRRLIKRGLAAGAGLTIFSLSDVALAARTKALANPPLRGKDITMAELVKEARKEGHLNLIATPPEWTNYGEIIPLFSKKFGVPNTVDNPEGTSAQEIQAVVSLKGQSRAPDALDIGPSFAVDSANKGLLAKYYVSNFKTIPRAEKDGRGYWTADYWGVMAFGANLSVVSKVPSDWNDLLTANYKFALNDDPRSANAAFSGVFAAALANGGSLNDITPGIDFFAKLAKAGKFQATNVTPQTVASGQTPVTMDWDYNQLSYKKTYTNFKWAVNIPKTGAYGGYYCQAINATAPHPFAARLWEEFIYSDQGQLLYLKGYGHPARFPDLVKRKVIPKALLAALPPASLYTGVKFASLGQIAKAKAIVAAQWGPKVLGA
ncbi:MAG: ABC transporter substrate-binding protein [Actinobacteria bacterium]|nr:MAG: ABC transporter substrate-binding protein [Actinomycetota bacterium]